MDLIFFNPQSNGLDKSRKLLSKYFVKQLLRKLEQNTASYDFFPYVKLSMKDLYLSIALVLFVNLHENSAIYFCNYFKSVEFDSPLINSSCFTLFSCGNQPWVLRCESSDWFLHVTGFY